MSFYPSVKHGRVNVHFKRMRVNCQYCDMLPQNHPQHLKLLPSKVVLRFEKN